MIVPGGGLSDDGTRWIACRPEFFLPVRVLSRLFRRLVIEMLLAAHASAKLAFFGTHAVLADADQLAALLAQLRRSECRVGEDVAILTPRRPGCADFPLPVPHGRASLAVAP
jgi:hypothetical protein